VQADMRGFNAKYKVPVEARLEKYSDFSISNVSYTKMNSQLILQYELPIELTGITPQLLTFSGNDDGQAISNLSGTHGSASCTASTQGLTCLMKMKDLQIDPARVAQLLKSNSANLAEFNARLEVAEKFSSEPVGIITYSSY